jgi:hypothetical protein
MVLRNASTWLAVLATAAILAGIGDARPVFAHGDGSTNENSGDDWTVRAYAQLSAPENGGTYQFPDEPRYSSGVPHRVEVVNDRGDLRSCTFSWWFELLHNYNYSNPLAEASDTETLQIGGHTTITRYASLSAGLTVGQGQHTAEATAQMTISGGVTAATGHTHAWTWQ